MRFSSGGCVANSAKIERFAPAGRCRRRSSGSAVRRSCSGTRSMRAGDLHQRRGERARAAGHHGGAAVGRELAVAREREHQEEGDRVDDERDERSRRRSRAVLVVVISAAAEEEAELEDHRRRARRRSHAIVMIITSRLLHVRELVRHDALELGGREQVHDPRRRADRRLLLRATQRERVGHRASRRPRPRLGQVGLDAEALDHRVQLRVLLRRHLARAHRAQRDLVGGEQLQREQAARETAIMSAPAPTTNSTPTNTAYSRPSRNIVSNIRTWSPASRPTIELEVRGMSPHLAKPAESSLRPHDAVTLFSAESPGNPGETGEPIGGRDGLPGRIGRNAASVAHQPREPVSSPRRPGCSR